MREWRSWLPMLLIAVVVPFGWVYPLLRGVRWLVGPATKPALQPVFIRRRRP
jgi:hypothetical protein